MDQVKEFLIGLLLLVTVISQWVTTLNRPGSYNATGTSLYAAVASLALLIALCAVGVGFLFASVLTRPVSDMTRVIQRMSNIDQVQQFVTDVLQLDSSNDIVKEFIRLINLSFKK